jgi:acyl-CoA thioesterase
MLGAALYDPPVPLDARTFLGLAPTDDPLRWQLPVTPGLSTPGRFLFGGCGLAAGVEAMEIVTSRPCVWATAQYLSYAPTGTVVDFEVIEAVRGHQVSQARAVGRVDGTEILTVNAALGRRSVPAEGEWAERPHVPPPEDCERREAFFRVGTAPPAIEGTVFERLEVRLARGRQAAELDGTPGDGRCALWTRMHDVLEPSAAVLAVFGDHLPSGLAQALGRSGGGRSLDNTIRVARLVPSEWVLVDMRIHSVHAGFGHGVAHLWAEDGTLLGTASQSASVHFWEGPPPRS